METRYDHLIKKLVEAKLLQTQQKIEEEGLLDEDDYGRIVPPQNKRWEIISNHQDGSFYGIEGWRRNFCDLMKSHPVYVDKHDAFAGRWMYFLSKMRPNIWNPDYPYNHLKKNILKYNIIDGIGYDAHFAPDFEMGLKLGWGGLKSKILMYRDKYNEDENKRSFYDAHFSVIEAVQIWIKNHISKIQEMLSLEKDPIFVLNLEEMLETNERILNDPPATFREACQWMIWFHLASRTYNRDGAGGQLDLLLFHFYKSDISKGIIDDEKVLYFLSCLLINDPVYWQLSGPDENGRDLTNPLSYLILEAAAKINTSLNLTIRVHNQMDPDFLEKSVSCLIKYKNGWPRYSGDNSLVNGFIRNGYPIELARKRIAVGCNWMSLPGLEYTMNDLVKVNIAKVFEVAFQVVSSEEKQIISTGILWEYFCNHLSVAIKTAADGIIHHLKYQYLNEPELLLNLLSHGPLEKGVDISNGGAEYYNLAIDGAGLGTVADSFSAIEQRVEKEKRLNWDELIYHLKNDFKGIDGEKCRSLMLNSERYGQGNTRGDFWAVEITRVFSKLVKDQSRNDKGLIFIPGWFSWANTLELGKNVGTTPDGRFAGSPISHGANPNPGFAKDGASTRMTRAIAMVQPGYGNTAPMQLELDPSFASKDQLNNIVALIKTHFKLGGTLLNVNILDKKKILEAHKKPDKYPDLIVRVTGFTAYFSMLSPEFRQLVVDRILEN